MLNIDGLDDTREIYIYIPDENKIKYLNEKQELIMKAIYIKFIHIEDMATETTGHRYSEEVFISNRIKQENFDGILNELIYK